MLASGIAGVIMMRVLPFADERALNVYRQFDRGLYRSLKPDYTEHRGKSREALCARSLHFVSCQT